MWLTAQLLVTCSLSTQLTLCVYFLSFYVTYKFYPVMMHGLFNNYAKLFPKNYLVSTPEIHTVIWSEFQLLCQNILNPRQKNGTHEISSYTEVWNLLHCCSFPLLFLKVFNLKGSSNGLSFYLLMALGSEFINCFIFKDLKIICIMPEIYLYVLLSYLFS